MFATEHGTAVVQSCHSKENEGGGFWAQDGASMKLTKCYTEGGQRGCGASAEATVVAEHCSVKGHDISSYLFEIRAAVKLTSCSATSSRQRGIIVAGAGTKLCMEEGTLSDNREHAAHVLHGAEAQLKKVKSSGHVIAGFVSLCTKIASWSCSSVRAVTILPMPASSLE